MSESVNTPFDLTAERIGPRLKVWWMPQVGSGAPVFEVLMNSLAESKVLVEALAQYDLFQFENNIKPDYSNAGGVLIFENDEWLDWEAEDGESIDDVSLDYCISFDREYYNATLRSAAKKT